MDLEPAPSAPETHEVDGSAVLLTQSGFLFMLTLAASGLNYAYQVLMARLLGAERFGELGALLSLLIIFGMPLAAIETGVAHHVAMWRHGRSTELDSLVRFLLVASTVAGLGLALMVGIGSVMFSHWLGLDADLLLLVAVGAGLMPLIHLHLARLQGMKRFLSVGAIGVATASAKLAAGGALVYAGFSVAGAFLGNLVGLLVTLATAIALVGKQPRASGSAPPIREFAAYTAPAMLGLLGFALLTNIDIVVVKATFSATEAGQYAATAVLGKTVLFVTAAVSAVMFPMVSENTGKGEGSRQLLKTAVLVTSAGGAAVALVFASSSVPITVWLFGEGFRESARILPVYGGAMVLMGLVQVAFNYFLARRKTGFALALPVLGLAEAALIFFFHSSLLQAASMVALTGAAAVVLAALYAWSSSRKRATP